jgi:capsular exopolysaccharide synthesis family protein
VDGDLRDPALHSIFELDADKGLSRVLTGQMSLHAAIQKGVAGGLDVLAAGPRRPNPSELLSGQAFADLVAHLSKSYDHIIIDSPSVLAVADALILGAMCDVTLMVVQVGKSMRRSSQQACERLAGVGSRILGVVANAAARRDAAGTHGGPWGHDGSDGSDTGGEPAIERAGLKQLEAIVAAGQGPSRN